jgi:hypothetical protein
MIDEIITGEKIQQLCDVYIGNRNDMNYNPLIQNQFHKHLIIDTIMGDFNNPKLLFCYAHCVYEFSRKINYFSNDFILITHNSDQNIEFTDCVKTILNSNKLIMWYAQNLVFEHEKIRPLPIGLANSMWPHGNLKPFNDSNLINHLTEKSENVYFNFKNETNMHKRYPCYNILKKHFHWLPIIDPVQNLYRLKKYRFCICPEGNGVDTHRLWECLYLRVVPIVIQSPFIQILTKYNVPLVILNEWSDLFHTNLDYNDYHFEDKIFNDFIHYTSLKIILSN